MYGWMGKILRVNLSQDRIKIEEPSEVFYRRYFGGRAVIAYHLLPKYGFQPFRAPSDAV